MIFPELSAQEEMEQLRSLERQAHRLDAQVHSLKEAIERFKRARQFCFSPQSRTTFVSHLFRYSHSSSWMEKMKPLQVIVHFLRQMDSPISQKALRELIIDEGYPAEKFGKNGVYFYVILDRLKKRGKLEKEGDEVRMLG